MSFTHPEAVRQRKDSFILHGRLPSGEVFTVRNVIPSQDGHYLLAEKPFSRLLNRVHAIRGTRLGISRVILYGHDNVGVTIKSKADTRTLYGKYGYHH